MIVAGQALQTEGRLTEKKIADSITIKELMASNIISKAIVKFKKILAITLAAGQPSGIIKLPRKHQGLLLHLVSGAWGSSKLSG